METGRGQPAVLPSGTIAICTRDRGNLLAEAVAALSADVGHDSRAEILIVEQGIPQASEVCARVGVRVRVINDDGLGLSRARNRAAREAQTPVILFIDDDCRVAPGWFAAHLKAYDDPAVAATFGAVHGLASIDTHDKHLPPTAPESGAVGGTRVALGQRAPWLVGHGANMGVRREVLLELGGFDERLGAGSPTFAGEDADLIVRLLRRGATVLTGVGPPVRHADWRSDNERRLTLIGYERGAGAWIGKALRNDGFAALPYLRTRLDYLLARIRDDTFRRKDVAGACRAVAEFLRGLLQGLRLSKIG